MGGAHPRTCEINNLMHVIGQFCCATRKLNLLAVSIRIKAQGADTKITVSYTLKPREFSPQRRLHLRRITVPCGASMSPVECHHSGARRENAPRMGADMFDSIPRGEAVPSRWGDDRMSTAEPTEVSPEAGYIPCSRAMMADLHSLRRKFGGTH